LSLLTPIKIRKLQNSFHVKAKTEPSYRFYSLWDKVCRRDILDHAYARCRANAGKPGVDEESFAMIDSKGQESWLGNLQKELREKSYSPSPLLRVWIPKSNGGQRPLGIPCIRDRVVQMAVLLVVNPIFEADLLPEQYGFRKGLDAKMAVRRVFFHLTQNKRLEVVDGDLSDYFNTIPHGCLMKCISRRIADGQVLSVIRSWLKVPAEERNRTGWIRTTEAKDQGRGTPQGGVISPLLANLYFRRFILAWKKFGVEQRLKANIVNYADDFVICCPTGNGGEAMVEVERLMKSIGLTLNEEKTRIATLPKDQFDFLGYSFARSYGWKGKPFIGTRPSKKALSRILRRIYDETSKRWLCSSIEKRIKELNAIIRGWCNYFNQGPVEPEHEILRRYTERRLRRWLQLKHKRRGTGYRQYPDKYLYERLGLYRPSGKSRSRSSAKA
jgi:RNA-directed DNA polymerase